MATISNRAIEVARTISGNSPWTIGYLEASGQTFKKGAYVTLNAAGFVVECGADPARIMGIASADAGNTTNNGDNTQLVWIACDDTIFVGDVSTTTAATDVGGRYGIVKNASSPFNWQVDKTDGAVAGGSTANAKVIVVQLDPRDNAGDTNGRLLFMVMGSASILTGTSPFV